MQTTRLGVASVECVVEHQFPVPLRLLTEDNALIEQCTLGLPDGFLDRDNQTFEFSNHSWVITVDDIIVLVDPCTGNGRRGRGPGFDDLDTPYLERLGGLGLGPEQIDVVFCTHLHHDHCGWNTNQVDGRWVPTFPNAEYVFVAEEYNRWDSKKPAHPNEFNPSVFDECVRPVVEAGLSRIVSVPYEISPSLMILAAPGHTTGHAMLQLESEGVRAYFTGDAFHHPIQLIRPELHLSGCDDLPAAIETRRRIIDLAMDNHALLFPAHFASPHYGHLTQDSGEVYFVSGGAPTVD